MATLRASRGLIARTPLWFDQSTLDDGFEKVPTQITTATVAQQIGAQGEQTPAHEQVANGQSWYSRTEDDVDGFLPIAAAFNPVGSGALQGADPTEGITNLQPTWAQPADLLGIREGVPDADVNDELVDNIDQSGQQNRSIQPLWFQPDTEALGDIPRPNVFDPVPLVAPTDQQPDISEQRPNGPTWFQTPQDPVDGMLYGDPPFAGVYDAMVLADGANTYFTLDEPQTYSPTGPAASQWGTSYDDANATREGTWHGPYTNQRPSLLTGDADTAMAYVDGGPGAHGAGMTVPAANAYNPGLADFTVEGWFATSAAAVQIIAAQGLEAGVPLSGWLVRVRAAGQVQFRTIDGAGVEVQAQTTLVYNDGVRHYFAASRDASGVRVVIDGNVAATSAGAAVDVTSSADFRIAGADASNVAFTGDLGKVALYPTALSTATTGTHWLVGSQGWAPLVQGADWTEQRANAATWFTPDLTPEGLTTGGVTVATVAAQAGLWQDQSGQQDRGIQPTWFTPEQDTFAQYPTIPVTPFSPGNGFPWLLADEYPARRDFTPDAVQASFEGTLQPWLFTTGSPGTGTGAAPAVLIDAETGDIYLSIGGNLIVSATNG